MGEIFRLLRLSHLLLSDNLLTCGMDLTTTPKAQELHSRAKKFIREELLPIEEEILHQGHETRGDWTQWQIDPRIDLLKEKARSQGLWNMFLPGHPEGLSNLDYAPIAEVTGYSILAPELFNCNAPDTGNMEVLWKYGSEEQKEQWLTQLLDGKIRSAFCMTEPAVASSDATNMEATITDKGDHIVLNGRKWWSSGIGHPNCKVLIFMGLSDAEGDARDPEAFPRCNRDIGDRRLPPARNPGGD